VSLSALILIGGRGHAGEPPSHRGLLSVPVIKSGTLAVVSILFACAILYLGTLPTTLMEVLSRSF